MKSIIRYTLNFEIFTNERSRHREHNHININADLMDNPILRSDGKFTSPFTESIKRCLLSQGEGDEQDHQY